MKPARVFCLAFLTLVFASSTFSYAGVPQMMNYQGKITTPAGALVDTTVQMTFTIYDDSTTGNVLWADTTGSVAVEKGIFSVLLGSGNPIPDSVFDGSVRYLGVKVGTDLEMTPRKEIVSVAYAFKSLGADTASYAHAGPGVADNDWNFRITDTADTTLMTGGEWGIARAGNVLYGNRDSTHVNLGVACTTGTSGQNYYYCTVVGGKRNVAATSYATVGGGLYNKATSSCGVAAGGQSNTASGVHQSTVGGGYRNNAGSNYSTVAGGYADTASGEYSTVAGGHLNSATDFCATVGGGQSNKATSSLGVVAGGQANTASGTHQSTVGGGYKNTASANYSTVAGGYADTASAENAIIGGGYKNTASGWSATIGGGYENTASGDYSTVAGGKADTASGAYSTVPGGLENTADGYTSFAAGYRAKANHSGTFVWGDYTYGATFASTGQDQFLIRASGGVGIGTNSPQGALDVSSTTGAFIVPRMTTAQRDALSAVNGMIIYNTTTNQFNFYENGAWVAK